jgi:hypothetical protein
MKTKGLTNVVVYYISEPTDDGTLVGDSYLFTSTDLTFEEFVKSTKEQGYVLWGGSQTQTLKAIPWHRITQISMK